MNDYIDLALCEDGSVFELPAFTHVEKGDVLVHSDGLFDVTTSITLGKDSDVLRFIERMYAVPIDRADGKMIRRTFVWEAPDGPNEPA